jgi:predicted GTPase
LQSPTKTIVDNIDYNLLLLTHMVCADQQIHSNESKLLSKLSKTIQASELTLQEMEKILSQDEDCISLEAVIKQISPEFRDRSIRQLLDISHSDGFFSPLERKLLKYIAKSWDIPPEKIELMIDKARSRAKGKALDTNEKQSKLSIGAYILKNIKERVPEALIDRVIEAAPKELEEKIEELHREILLAGPEYDEAIAKCSVIAHEDFIFADHALKETFSALMELRQKNQQLIEQILQSTKTKGTAKSAQEVGEKLKETCQDLDITIIKDVDKLRSSLQAKKRAMSFFSIAFMGRTKAGKSTLHAVITGEGWNAIGIGKQRTTRYNRVYEWKNMRIIDTPGIGAPDGKSDEEIAESIIDEADVICYVVTNDSIQETDFHFLKLLKEKTKPLTILLNIKHNLIDKRRLEYFLKNPDKLFELEGKSGIGGHIERIRRYANQHYANNYFDIIPVMLLAAQLSEDAEHQNISNKLSQASRLQNFLDSLRVSLIDHGAIRRSQTMLGSTVGAIDSPYKWLSAQTQAYEKLTQKLKNEHKKLKRTIQQSQEDSWQTLQQQISQISQDALNCIPSFAENYWEVDEATLETNWKNRLSSIQFEKRLSSAYQEAGQTFQREVQEAIEEIGTELELLAQLKFNSSYRYNGQKSNFFDDRDLIRIGRNILAVVGVALTFTPFAPIGIVLSVAAGILSFFTNAFKSRDQKRREAVQRISDSLYKHNEEQKKQNLIQLKQSFHQYCRSISSGIDTYFDELIQGLDAIESSLGEAKNKLFNAENDLNCAYAKRILDWATNTQEPLSKFNISKSIEKVDRNFGYDITIKSRIKLTLRKTQEEIQNILQENILIQMPEIIESSYNHAE